MTKTVLVVGAGFAGAVLARELAENNVHVDVIDKRPHIGGNAYDQINRHGERIHVYGPHLLHGDRDSVAVRWLSRFTDWTPYEHRVRALLPTGTTTPLPVNRTTMEDVFGVRLQDEEQAKNFLSQRVHKIKPSNTDEVFLANVGSTLADLLFRPYTKKMWGVDAKQLEASIGARLPVRFNRDDRYFTDSFQAMPTNGFTAMFERILEHPRVSVTLNTEWEQTTCNEYDHIFSCSPLDEFFEYRFGHLPYRSIRFVSKTVRSSQPTPVVNFTDQGIYTRSTQWDLIANSNSRRDGHHTVTLEIPCDASENENEYYYPVRNKGSLGLYDRYSELAEGIRKITFVGRTGLFRYLDMIPCINLHLQIAKSFLKSSGIDAS